MEGERTATLCGQVATSWSLVRLCRKLKGLGMPVELRESCHYEEGWYLRIRADSYITLERIDGGVEYLVAADAETPKVLTRDAEWLSQALGQLDLKHRLEIYSAEGELIGYYHLDWPLSL